MDNSKNMCYTICDVKEPVLGISYSYKVNHMKLYIADKLKQLRIAKNLTQEQLAYNLGVSAQSVSRWENDNSYPDIEFIPEIARFFGVSTDELMGVSRAFREAKFNEEWEIFRIKQEDADTAIDRLRKIHRDFPEKPQPLVRLLLYLSEDDGENYAEQRELTEKLLKMETASQSDRDYAKKWLIMSAPESDLPELLTSFATGEDMRREALLDARCGFGSKGAGEMDVQTAGNGYKQYYLLSLIYGIFRRLAHVQDHPSQEEAITDCERAVRRKLELINLFAGTSGMNLVSGDGEPDLWYSERVDAGLRLSCYCASTDRKEEALYHLEDTTRLFERFYSMPEGTKLTFRCPEMDRLSLTWYTGVRNPEDVKNFKDGLVLCKRSEETFFSLPMYYDRKDGMEEFDHNVECPVWDMYPLEAEQGWEWFDPIRDNPHFKALVARMRHFVIPVSPDEQKSFPTPL